MKYVFLLSLSLIIANTAQAEPYKCIFEDGTAVDTRFPCDAVLVERFGKRVLELYPELQDIEMTTDYIKNLYIFAMAGCTGHFRRMTPEEIGKNGEPLFPWRMGAAMAHAAREVICPVTQ